jgi:hypothetical protein
LENRHIVHRAWIILAHWVTGVLRDMSGDYYRGFGVGAAMPGIGL